MNKAIIMAWTGLRIAAASGLLHRLSQLGWWWWGLLRRRLYWGSCLRTKNNNFIRSIYALVHNKLIFIRPFYQNYANRLSVHSECPANMGEFRAAWTIGEVRSSAGQSSSRLTIYRTQSAVSMCTTLLLGPRRAFPYIY